MIGQINEIIGQIFQFVIRTAWTVNCMDCELEWIVDCSTPEETIVSWTEKCNIAYICLSPLT